MPRRAVQDRIMIARHLGTADDMRDCGPGALMVRTRYAAFDGPVRNGPLLRIGLCEGRSVTLRQRIGDSRIDGLWRPGSVIVSPPDATGYGSAGATAMLGLAIDPRSPPWSTMLSPETDRLHALATRFHHDPLLSSVLCALWHEADVHGGATAFFEHGVALVLSRLREIGGIPPEPRSTAPLGVQRLARVRALVESRLDDAPSVTEMAAAVGMESSGFGRAFRARTGLTPYAWITALRMDRATAMLTTGQTVSTIAMALGYANAGKFAAAFRRIHGTSPSAWRAGHR